MTDDLTELKRLLRAREGRAGYSYNVEKLKARIAELEARNG